MNEQSEGFNPKTMMGDAERDKHRRSGMARDIQQVAPVLRTVAALLIYVFRRQNTELSTADAYERADHFIEQMLMDIPQ